MISQIMVFLIYLQLMIEVVYGSSSARLDVSLLSIELLIPLSDPRWQRRFIPYLTQ